MWCWLYYGRAVDKACVVNNVQEAWYPHMQLSWHSRGPTCRWITFLHSLLNKLQTQGDSTQQWNGTRGIKNNKEMANCAPQPNLISSHQLTESRQCILMIASFYRAQRRVENISQFLWLTLEFCSDWRNAGPVWSVFILGQKDWGVRQAIIREISVSTQTAGH